MKNIFYLFIFISLIFSSCEEEVEVAGCMDDCALNYSSSATIDDSSCIYSFLGTYTISEYKQDGISLFSNYWENPLVAGAIAFDVGGNMGVYGASYLFADGSELVSNGSFENSSTQLILYPSDGSAAQLWTTTKINCLEFDGNTMINGVFSEIELTYYSGRLDNLEKTATSEKFNPSLFKKRN
tara:strand:- start:171 stop:719 length:549 start_codon:yes stop_codon:yes gene_type:complete